MTVSFIRFRCRDAVASAMISVVASFGLSQPTFGQDADDQWPRRVLITNDNGIEDPKLWALAETISEFAEVFIAAAMTDQSGTGSSLSLFRTGSIRVVAHEAPEGITAYAVDGYPADCVVWALVGPMLDAPPDLVISGINGGPNIGTQWFGSGTVGAARTAAMAGIPAIAVSGLDDSNAESVTALTGWVGALAQSAAARSMEPGDYLTVSAPLTPPDQIKGVKLAPRETANGVLHLTMEADENGGEVWSLAGAELPELTPGADIATFVDGWIVVIPMSVRETDQTRLGELAAQPDSIPGWGD